MEFWQLSNQHLSAPKLSFSNGDLSRICGKLISFVSRRSSILYFSNGARNTQAKDCIRPHGDSSDASSMQVAEEEDGHPVMPGRTIHSSQGLAEACKFVYNDAKFVNERAHSDFVLLSRSIMRLDARARQDVAIIGSEFLKLNARAREDTEKIDRNVKQKAESLHHIATILNDKAKSRLKNAADKHWSDGALEQRAMKDALMALEFVKNIHDMMIRKMYKFPLRREKVSLSNPEMMGCIMLEKNGKTLDFFSGEVSSDRITKIQEAYWSMASALSEVDGIDYTDPEEVLMQWMEKVVYHYWQCSSSPDENTRQALANALAAAPSIWALGNAGMGALRRLAEDSNLAIAAAASKTIYELKKQWEIEEGDSWRFMMNRMPAKVAENEANDDADTD